MTLLDGSGMLFLPAMMPFSPMVMGLGQQQQQGGSEAAAQALLGGGSTCSTAAAAAPCSDTSSTPLPNLDASDITIVPVTSLNGASLAAAAALSVAVEQQQQQQQRASPDTAGAILQQQRTGGDGGSVLEALRGRRRLLFTQAPPDCTEGVMRAWFGRFGAVEGVQLYCDPAQPPCSGLITMATHAAAAAALAALHDASSPPPAPISKLSVRWLLQPDGGAAAAPAAPAPAPVATAAASADVAGTDGSLAAPALASSANRTVFFAKVPPSALASEVELLFGSFGKLQEVNLFRAWAGAKHSKGCGLITYVDRAHAAAAIAALHSKYVFPNSDCAMVVEWIDLRKQRPMTVPTAEKPPMGAACDSVKLQLTNIPASTTEDVLHAALAQFGPVVLLSLEPDATGPCASGHLWFVFKASADALVAHSRQHPIWLRDSRSHQDLALVVRKSRRTGAGAAHSGATASRINVGSLSGSFATNMLSSGSNTSSGYVLPIHGLHSAGSLHTLGSMHHHSQPLTCSSARLAAAASGFLPGAGGVASGSMLDALGALEHSGVLRLLPMQQQQQQQQQPATSGMFDPGCHAMMSGGGPACGGLGGGYAGGNSSGSLAQYFGGLPMHMQPAMAAQMALRYATNGPGFHCLPPQREINSTICLPQLGMMAVSSGQHCLSSPANIQAAGLDEYEGSFSMPGLRIGGGGNNGSGNSNNNSMQQQQDCKPQPGGGVAAPQLVSAPSQQQQQQQAPGSGMLWQPTSAAQPGGAAHHQQLQYAQGGQGQQHAHGISMQAQQQQQQQQQVPQQGPSAGGLQSIALPLAAYEVQAVAENLSFFATQSGARITISSAPGIGLALLLTGAPEQVATAQALLAAARGQR